MAVKIGHASIDENGKITGKKRAIRPEKRSAQDPGILRVSQRTWSLWI